MSDELTNQHYSELVSAALNDRAGWVPLGPLNGARHRKLTGPYSRPNYLADLERMGLISLTEGKSKQTATIRLTEAGKDAICAMPDKLPGDHFFPLPRDITAAKAKLDCEGRAYAQSQIEAMLDAENDPPAQDDGYFGPAYTELDPDW